jgi:hypothetical protein
MAAFGLLLAVLLLYLYDVVLIPVLTLNLGWVKGWHEGVYGHEPRSSVALFFLGVLIAAVVRRHEVDTTKKPTTEHDAASGGLCRWQPSHVHVMRGALADISFVLVLFTCAYNWLDTNEIFNLPTYNRDSVYAFMRTAHVYLDTEPVLLRGRTHVLPP